MSNPWSAAPWLAAGHRMPAEWTPHLATYLVWPHNRDTWPGKFDVIPPIYATSTYKQDGVGGLRGGYEYSRSANPTRTALEECLAAIEAGNRGFAFASGLAAEDTLIRALCVPGDHMVFPDDAYRAPETWARRAYPNLSYFHEVDKGGHFAAWEQPELFATELRAAFTPMRRAG